MAFSFKAIAQSDASSSRGGVQVDFSYSGKNALADDDLATIKASGYFNDFSDSLEIGDKIYVLDNADAVDLLHVTAVSPDVTVASLRTDLPPGSVGLNELEDGIKPSHVVKFAGKQATTGGGGDTEAYNIPGILNTDLAFAQMEVLGGGPVTVNRTFIGAPNILSVQFSGDPGADHTFAYQILRAAV